MGGPEPEMQTADRRQFGKKMLQNFVRGSVKCGFLSSVAAQRSPSCIVLFRSVHVQAESDGEKHIANVLKSKFSATTIAVKDISGGCGAMYEVFVESEEFKGKRTVQQHRLVTNALATEVKEMHGIRVSTKIPDNSEK